jgi:hypothetical protein
LLAHHQLVAIMQEEREPESRTTYVSCWPHLVDLFSPLSDSA